MRVAILLLYFGTAFAYDRKSDTSLGIHQGMFFQPATFQPQFNSGYNDLHNKREKRDAAGALHIVTNHAQPIHADVKTDGNSELTEKVTAPEDTFYELKSLRKSWPLPNKLELVRSISRVVTLAALVICGVVEFFPMLRSLYNVVYSFIYL